MKQVTINLYQFNELSEQAKQRAIESLSTINVDFDCDRYMTKKELKGIYPESFIKENKDNFVIVEGIKYFYAEYSPMNIDEDWELLSDLSELYHVEEDFDF